jgi:hypothetical protein
VQLVQKEETVTTPFALGRNLNHDPRSRNFPVQSTVTNPRTVLHALRAPVLDQGHVGSCVGNAIAQLINTAAFDPARAKVKGAGAYLDENDALALYSEATQLDGFPGSYPPDDVGSDGLSGCKAGVQAGYLTEYRHAFSFDEFLLALQDQPVIVGTNWYDSMFNPDSWTGAITVGGNVVGGHEYLVLGANMEREFITIQNSWGSTWGYSGRFRMSFADCERLLGEQGDVTVPIGSHVAA